MPYGPCMICGATNYPSSMGGPMICPQCDCDNFGQRRIEQQGTQLQQVIAERDQLAAKVAEAEIISTAALQRSSYLANTKLGFVEALDACQRGLALWRDKPHNFKWWNRIDGTPIPNDLLVCIAEILQHTANADRVQRDAVLAELAQVKAENEKLRAPFVAGVDFGRQPSRNAWGCTCGRWATTEYELYSGCENANCPNRPTPPKETTK